MAIFRRTMSVVLILGGGAVFSQAPEFTQQYRQRIGGALDELQAIVSAFEAQAAQFGLDRQAALKTYAASQSPFLAGQGDTMRSTLRRYDALALQQAELEREPAVTRPLVLMRHVDLQIVRNAWRDFIPAVPIDLAGLIWSLAGCLFGWAMSSSLYLFSKRPVRHRSEEDRNTKG